MGDGGCRGEGSPEQRLNPTGGQVRKRMLRLRPEVGAAVVRVVWEEKEWEGMVELGEWL
jgi:hypothetical protein